MSFVRGLNVGELLKRGGIRDADVCRFRRAFAENGPLNRHEAELLLAINDGCPVQDVAWAPPFVAAITDFIVNREAPEGYIAVHNAEWLAAHIATQGCIDSKVEIELLVAVLEKARWAPESFCMFALDQVKRAVVGGRGPLRAGQSLPPGHITTAEVDTLRRILLAFASDGSIAITAAEAEALFAIEEALTGGEVNPAWTDLFVKAVANAMLAAVGHKVPPREDALKSAAVGVAAENDSPAAVLADVVRASLVGAWSGCSEQSREERAIGDLERRRIEIITNEPIAAAAPDWLAARLGRAGRVSASGLALVEVLRSESPRMGQALQELVGRIPVAA